MDYCHRYSRVAWSHQPDNICLLTRLRCKQWSCDYCAKANQRMWRSFLMGQLPLVADNWWFVTLTAHSKKRQQQQSYQNLQRLIAAIIKRIRRVWSDVNYVRVFEVHPSSKALHAHLLVSNLTPFVVPGCNKNLQPCFLGVLVRKGHTGFWSVRTWFKKTAYALSSGYQAEVSPVRDSYAIHYVVKYLSKDSQRITIKGLRHVSTSHRIGSPSYESTKNWDVGSFITAMDMLSSEELRDLQTGQSLSYADIAQAGIYPPETDRDSAPAV